MKTCEGCIRCTGIRGTTAICRRFVSYDGMADLRIVERPNIGCRDYKEIADSRGAIALGNYKAKPFSDFKENHRRMKMPDNFSQIAKSWVDGKITTAEATKQCGCCTTTFYHNANALGFHKPSGFQKAEG